MHKIGVRPPSRAAHVLAATWSSVSPAARRSEWPVITYSQPQAFSISALISPVWAPLASACTFCAPSLTQPSLRVSATGIRLVNDGQISISTLSQVKFWFSSFAKVTPNSGVPFIFQLPAIRVRIDMGALFLNLVMCIKLRMWVDTGIIFHKLQHRMPTAL